MTSTIKKIIDELGAAVTNLETELALTPVSQPRTAALRRVVQVHRKELNVALTILVKLVPKLERVSKAPKAGDQPTTKPANTTEDVKRYSTTTPPPFDVNAPGQPGQPVPPQDPTRRVPTPTPPTKG